MIVVPATAVIVVLAGMPAPDAKKYDAESPVALETVIVGVPLVPVAVVEMGITVDFAR